MEMQMSNSPQYDNALRLSGNVGSNFKTLRDNKRKLAHSLILAVAVEDFRWKEAWMAVKAKAGFAKLDKPEQNQLNVLGTACRVIIDSWADLDADTKASFINGDIVFSTLAKVLKDAEKAKDEAEAKAGKEAENVKEAASHADADNATPETARLIAMRSTIAAMDALIAGDAETLSADEYAMLGKLLDKVDELRASIAEAASKAA